MNARRFLLIGGAQSQAWQQALTLALGTRGLLETASWPAALTALERHHYELVLIDVTAVAEVVEVVSELHQRWETLPVIVAAAATDWEQARAVFRVGATDYICKSYDQQELFSLISAILAQAAAVR